MTIISVLFDWIAVIAVAGLIVYSSIAAILPWLRRLALAVPNSRSSHDAPTPQGGGIVVVAVAVVSAGVALALVRIEPAGGAAYALTMAVAALALSVIGLIDDARGLPIAPRLAAQAVAVTAAVLLLPAEARLFPNILPAAVERALLVAAGLWFINVVNFMDGIDWISALETVTIAGGVAIIAALDVVPTVHGYVAVALLGAMLGFMPWNAPPARLFLGDAGSIPIGFLTGVLLLHIALSGAVAAAVILPLYYLSDATITILRRAWRRERIWQAHRSHFYQLAIRNGLTVRQTVGRIAIANALLVPIAAASAISVEIPAAIFLLLAGGTVAATLYVLAKGRP